MYIFTVFDKLAKFCQFSSMFIMSKIGFTLKKKERERERERERETETETERVCRGLFLKRQQITLKI